MSCLEVRERLTEYALGLLPAAEAEQIEQHLEWCPGCRKEAADLAEGAASFGLAMPQVQPPATLEGKVLGRLRGVTRRTGESGLRQVRVLVGATLIAALVALGAFGWALAERNHALTLEERLAGMRSRVENFAELLKTSGVGKTFQAELLPSEGAGDPLQPRLGCRNDEEDRVRGVGPGPANRGGSPAPGGGHRAGPAEPHRGHGIRAPLRWDLSHHRH